MAVTISIFALGVFTRGVSAVKYILNIVYTIGATTS